MPLFLSRNVEEGPAFLVECRNMTGAPIASGSRFWPHHEDAIRIDHVGRRGRVSPGRTVDIPPGGTWRGIIELRRAEPPTGFAVELGADVRAQFVVPLTAGVHRIAVRCGDTWLDELPFYWER
jgi:hypothetical protein